MSSEALTSIPLTSLPRLSQGKVRYGNSRVKTSPFFRRFPPSPVGQGDLHEIPSISQWLAFRGKADIECGRDLFSLPDGHTLLFVTSGMLILRLFSVSFLEILIQLVLDRISAYDVILKVSYSQP